MDNVVIYISGEGEREVLIFEKSIALLVHVSVVVGHTFCMKDDLVVASSLARALKAK